MRIPDRVVVTKRAKEAGTTEDFPEVVTLKESTYCLVCECCVSLEILPKLNYSSNRTNICSRQVPSR